MRKKSIAAEVQEDVRGPNKNYGTSEVRSLFSHMLHRIVEKSITKKSWDGYACETNGQFDLDNSQFEF